MRRVRKGPSVGFVGALAAPALLLSLCVAGSLNAADQGLVAHYDFSEGAGTKAHDRSGRNNHGAILGAKYVKCGAGYALKLDGADDYVDCGSNNSLKPLTSSWTVEVWFNTATDARQGLVSFGGGGDSYYLDVYDKRELHWTVRDYYANDHITGKTQPLCDGKWHHGVGVRDEADAKLYLYLDGVADATPIPAAKTGGKSIAPKGEGKSLHIGVVGPYPFKGLIGEIRVYNRALSLEEIKKRYQETRDHYKDAPTAEKPKAKAEQKKETRAASAKMIAMGDFQLASAATLHIRHKGKALIERDELSFTGHSVKFVEGDLKLRKEEDEVILHLSGSEPEKISYRKEVAVRQDAVEITFWDQLDPYTGARAMRYTLCIPAAFLSGMKYRAVVGRGDRTQFREGTLSEDKKDGAILPGSRYIAFSGRGKELRFDFDPRGANGACGVARQYWHFAKAQGFYRFSAWMWGLRFGTRQSTKVVISFGPDNFAEIHPLYHDWYDRPLKPSLFLDFGGDACSRGSSPAGRELYSDKKGHGWERAKGLEVVDRKGPRTLRRDFIKGRSDNTFDIKCKNGLYIATLIIGDTSRAVKAFDVYAEGELKLQQKALDRGQFKSQSFAVRVEDEKLNLKFHAPKDSWLINGVILQPLIYASEDYTFLKPWWRWAWQGKKVLAY